MDDLSGGAHDRIRVGLGAMPTLVMEMLRRSLVDAGIDVVTLADSAAGWANCTTVDVMIVPADAAGIQPRSCDLLRSRPRMKMLTLSTETDHADLFELRLVGTNVGLQGVVAAVRSGGAAEQWIKEGKQAAHWTRLSCHRFSGERGSGS